MIKADLIEFLSKFQGVPKDMRPKLDQVIDLLKDSKTQLPRDNKLAYDQSIEFLTILLNMIFPNKVSAALNKNKSLIETFVEKSQPKKTSNIVANRKNANI